jgi:AbrB family looped-hinge helix DNA binding protein
MKGVKIMARVIESSKCMRITIPKYIVEKLELKSNDILIIDIENIIRAGTILGSLT